LGLKDFVVVGLTGHHVTLHVKVSGHQ
jgi:hypothetical protein